MSEVASRLQERRLEFVREHMQSENEHRFDDTLRTFDHPRYEIMATGDVHDGPEEVAEYYRTSRAAFPDQRNEAVVLHQAQDAVIAGSTCSGRCGRAARDRADRPQLPLPDVRAVPLRAGRPAHSSASASTSTRRRSPSRCSEGTDAAQAELGARS